MSPERHLLFEQGYLAGFKDLVSDDRIAARRLMVAVNSLARNPKPENSAPLAAGGLTYRLNVGDYRVLYEVTDDTVRVWSLGRVLG